MTAPLNDTRTPPLRVAGIIFLLVLALIIGFLLLQFRQMLLQEFSYLFAGIGRFHVHVAFITRWVLRCQQAIKEAQKGQN